MNRSHVIHFHGAMEPDKICLICYILNVNMQVKYILCGKNNVFWDGNNMNMLTSIKCIHVMYLLVIVLYFIIKHIIIYSNSFFVGRRLSDFIR